MSLSATLTETIRECRRPWKLATLAIGIALLIIGADIYHAPDWDILVSLIMAACTYLTAGWSMRVVMERRWHDFPTMLFATWFSVDGCYWIYWHFTDPRALELMRSANAPASLCLYATCGLIWLYRGSLREMWADALALHKGIKAKP